MIGGHRECLAELSGRYNQTDWPLLRVVRCLPVVHARSHAQGVLERGANGPVVPEGGEFTV
eukprot:3398622-Pyramimonas_sp.AAC.1